MWRLVLALSIFAGTAVFSAEVTFPVSVEFGEDLLTFSEDNGVLHYTIGSKFVDFKTNFFKLN